MSQSITALALREIAFKIPRELLNFLSTHTSLVATVARHIDTVRSETMYDIPVSCVKDVLNYVVSRVQQDIYELYKKDTTGWEPEYPLCLETLDKYPEACDRAAEQLLDIKKRFILGNPYPAYILQLIK